METLRDKINISGYWTFAYSDGTSRTEKNLITQSGLNTLAALFIGEIPQDSSIYLALGTGTAAAVAGDVALGAENFRKILTSKTRNINEARLRFYLMSSEAIGNWSEAGLFIAGTTETGSGQLLNRILPTGGINKASNQVMTIEVRIPFTAG